MPFFMDWTPAFKSCTCVPGMIIYSNIFYVTCNKVVRY